MSTWACVGSFDVSWPQMMPLSMSASIVVYIADLSVDANSKLWLNFTADCRTMQGIAPAQRGGAPGKVKLGKRWGKVEVGKAEIKNQG